MKTTPDSPKNGSRLIQLIMMDKSIHHKWVNILIYLHFSKTSLDEPLDVYLCSYFHEQHCVTRRDVIQTLDVKKHESRQSDWTL